MANMTNTLYNHPTYTARAELLETDARVLLAYHRAKAVTKAWNLSLEDIGRCSKRFWDMQFDPILVLDIGCNNILACHINLFLGFLAPLVPQRPDLLPIVQRGLKGELFGNFLISEIGHGLDILNLETTATKVADGFILNTPHSGATKFMPPTTPIPGYPKMAIVMAKLIVDGDDRGAHPFLVSTSDEFGMCKGVISTRLPPRSGSSPLDYATTFFDHVHLPPNAFLGKSHSAPQDKHAQLNRYIWRIGIGAIALPLTAVTAAKIGASIGIDYSFRRYVQGKGPEKVPIISFRTQQLPVLYATAIARVLEAWRPKALEQFMAPDVSSSVRSGVAVVFKATVCRLVVAYFREVGERLGAQGTFGHNLLSQMEMDTRGISIAEGDVLVLSIRLFSELLIGRYALPAPGDPSSLLARHSTAIFARCKKLLASFPGGHRDARFNDLLLPQAEPALVALGHAYAYAAARDAGLPQPLLDLFECAVMKLDAAWYAEHAGIGEDARMMREDAAVRAALPHIREYADALDVRRWVTAPIVSDKAWEAWVKQLRSHRGDGLQESYGRKQALMDVPILGHSELVYNDGPVSARL
ncbi:hypothetical protein B0H21DRAFT_177663 [Amylocystis lapponica]|nr:hypothetical protein B0H21DRAFT_177663 [Amylocystis lapponica]